jgi:hypothetical protein
MGKPTHWDLPPRHDPRSTVDGRAAPLAGVGPLARRVTQAYPLGKVAHSAMDLD